MGHGCLIRRPRQGNDSCCSNYTNTLRQVFFDRHFRIGRKTGNKITTLESCQDLAEFRATGTFEPEGRGGAVISLPAAARKGAGCESTQGKAGLARALAFAHSFKAP